ncbi:MAG: DNA recombination protein RmuC, partial [Myxococcales bacterium]
LNQFYDEKARYRDKPMFFIEYGPQTADIANHEAAYNEPYPYAIWQREYRVVVAGPTTLGALLNSLQMGFRTLAIEQRSSEVWRLLGAVKGEVGRFGEMIERVQKKLQEAANVVDRAASKSRTIERKLRDVEELPSSAEGSALDGLMPLENESSRKTG